MDSNSANLPGWISRQLAFFEKYRFGAMAMLMTIQSCYAGVAVYYVLGAGNSMLLTFCAITTMASNAFLIAQAPAKWCVLLFYLCMISSTLVLLASIF